MRERVLAILLVTGAIGVAGCGGSGETTTTKKGEFQPRTYPTDVGLTEWKVYPEASRVTAGRVLFRVQNSGQFKHSFVVIRTDQDASELGGSTAGKVGEIPEVNLGQPGTLEINMQPGHYALICGLPGHYQRGMYENLDVRREQIPGGAGEQPGIDE